MKKAKIANRLSALLLALVLSLSLSVPAFAAEETLDRAKAPAAAQELTGATVTAWAVWREGEIVESGSTGGEQDLFGVGSVSKI